MTQFKSSLLVTGRLTFLLVFLFTSIAFLSCDNRKDAKEAAEERNEELDEQVEGDLNKERDEDFLIKAAEINLEVIRLSELAQQKGSAPDVKELANKMVNGHTKAMNDLKNLASSKSIAIPTTATDKVQNAYENLNEKAVGDDFDKEYCDKMVKGHRDAIDAYEKASSNAADPDIKSWAASMLPDLRMHLEEAIACDDRLKKM